MLRRHPLAALLAAEVISVTGSVISELALSWFVLATTGSPAKMALVLGVEMTSIAVFGIPGGSIAARLGTRRTLLTADLARGLLIAIVPTLFLLDALSFPVLLVIVFAIGSCFAPYQASQVVLLSEVVGDDERLLARANALLLGANRTTALLGSPVSGVLIAFAGAKNVLWIDAATFFVSFVLIRAFVPATARQPEDEEDARGLLAGLRWLWREPLLKSWTLAISGFELAWQGLFAAIPVLAFLEYHERPQVAGILFGCFGAGALAGNVAVLPLLRKARPRRLVVLAKIPQALAFCVLVADFHAVTVGAVLLVAGFTTGLIGGPATAIQTNRIPKALRAKALSAFMTITLLAGAAGLAGSGPLIEAAGFRWLFLVLAVLQVVGTIWFVLALVRAPPTREEREQPWGEEEAGAPTAEGQAAEVVVETK
jgi:MFS family permease